MIIDVQYHEDVSSYEYDPLSKTIRQMADIQSAVKGFKRGDFGFGKIHGRLNEGPDGKIYFATYWGQWRTQSEHYHGDRVFCRLEWRKRPVCVAASSKRCRYLVQSDGGSHSG